MYNLIKFLKCKNIHNRISIIKECKEKINTFKMEKHLTFDKKEISNILNYPDNVRVVEEKNMKINVLLNCSYILVYLYKAIGPFNRTY